MDKIIQNYFLIIVFIGASCSYYSQQYPQYTQYTYNMNVVNPAYAGSRDGFTINSIGKKQWVGVEGSPKTGTLSIHSPVGRNVGLGFSAIYDEIGPLKDTHIHGDFSYSLTLTDQSKLALGIKAGVSFQNLNSSLFKFNELQNFNNDFNNTVSPNFGFGVFYYEEKFYIGASIPNFLTTEFLERNTGFVSTVSKSSAIFLTSGYVIDISKNYKIKPTTMIRYAAGYPVSFDVSATAFLQKTVEVGVSYRYKQSMNYLFAINVNSKFKIGYAYDYSLGDLSIFNNGSHEILLLYNLPKIDRGRKRLWF